MMRQGNFVSCQQW